MYIWVKINNRNITNKFNYYKIKLDTLIFYYKMTYREVYFIKTVFVLCH